MIHIIYMKGKCNIYSKPNAFKICTVQLRKHHYNFCLLLGGKPPADNKGTLS